MSDSVHEHVNVYNETRPGPPSMISEDLVHDLRQQNPTVYTMTISLSSIEFSQIKVRFVLHIFEEIVLSKIIFLVDLKTAF